MTSGWLLLLSTAVSKAEILLVDVLAPIVKTVENAPAGTVMVSGPVSIELLRNNVMAAPPDGAC